MRLPSFAAFVVLLLTGCEADAPGIDRAHVQEETVLVEDAWARPIQPQEAVQAHSAIYFRITNRGDDALALVGASSEAAPRIEIHETLMEDGVMRMRPRPEVSLPPGEPVDFAPGGLHLMVMDVQRDLIAGDSLTITLTFDDDSAKQVPVMVRPATL